MKSIKSKITAILCCTILVCNLVACGSNTVNNENGSTTNVKEENNANSEDIKSNEVVFDKKEIKLQIEAAISKDVKGKSYIVDMLTPIDGEGYIASIQVDNDKFISEDECKKFTEELINNIKGIDGIFSVEITFVAESQMKYMVRIEDWNKSKNIENIVETLDFSV